MYDNNSSNPHAFIQGVDTQSYTKANVMVIFLSLKYRNTNQFRKKIVCKSREVSKRKKTDTLSTTKAVHNKLVKDRNNPKEVGSIKNLRVKVVYSRKQR